MAYLDAVEEGICHGWIDSIQKCVSAHERGQRFSPRKPRGNRTELNKERFLAFPELYRRIRRGYVEEQRHDPAEFERRLGSLVRRTAAGTMFGNWNDGGRLG